MFLTMKRTLLLLVCYLALISGLSYAAQPSESTDKIRRILKGEGTPTELLDSAMDVYMSECTDGPDELAEGEDVMRSLILPFMERNGSGLSDFKRSEVFCQYGTNVGQQDPSRFGECMALLRRAMDFARRAGDSYMIGFVYYRMSFFEDRHGSTEKAFEYLKESTRNYKLAPEDVGREISGNYYRQAYIYQRIGDYDAIRGVIDDFEEYVMSASESAYRPYMLYKLLELKNVYFDHQFDSGPSDRRRAMRDSLGKVTAALVSLVESSDDPMIQEYSEHFWIYYNRAQFFIKNFDRPLRDSVERYVGKMRECEKEAYGPVSRDYHVAVGQTLGEMWAAIGDYPRARDIFFDLADELKDGEGSKSLILSRIEIYQQLRDLSEKTGHFREALAAADSVSALERRRFDNEHRDAIKDIEIRYRTQETELALARSEGRRASTLMWLFAAAGLLLAVIVVFVLYASRQRRRRLQKDMEFAALRADTVRQLTEQYVEGLENERRRMSAELHDGVCNDLLAIGMNIRKGISPEATARMVEGCRESVRRISHELMPPEFAYASLDEVLRFFVAKQAEASGALTLRYRSELSEDAALSDISDNVALEVYRIVQEAVGNALRHSGASEIIVSLTLDPRELSAIVSDNGRFISSGKKGIGLDSMRRRARSIGADVTLSGSENGGTELRLNVKITENRN